MLTTQTLPAISATTPSPTSRRPEREILAVAIVAGLAHLPLLARHAAWLWQRPHYQFFPLVMLGAAVLAYARMGKPTKWRAGSSVVAATGLSAAWFLLACADFLASQWLGCVSIMVLIATLVYAAGGRELTRQALPAWVLLWLVVPPPLDLDRLLMFKLQNLTTGWSSAVLDVLGVYHVRLGNVIEVDERKMMVEQACSGINSLYSLLACTLFLVFLTRRGWIRGTLLVASAVAWVLIANVARVTGIVLFESRWGVDLSTGWRHEAFGILLFTLAVGLLLSTDQLFSFLTSSVPPAFDGHPSQPSSESPIASRKPHTLGMRRIAAVGIPAYLLLAIGYWAADNHALDIGVAPAQLPPPERDRLPVKIGTWEHTRFATQSREENSFYGEHSSIWMYSRTRYTAVISLDYPFPSWHDLTWCYVGKGWRIDNQEVRSESGVPGGFVEVRMSQPTNQHGYLLFCEFDSSGQPFTARPGGTEASLFRHQTTLLRVKARLGFDREPFSDPPGPVYQLQMFLEGYDRLPAEDESAAVDLFVRTRAALAGSCVAKP